jgi:hypothetical protein
VVILIVSLMSRLTFRGPERKKEREVLLDHQLSANSQHKGLVSEGRVHRCIFPEKSPHGRIFPRKHPHGCIGPVTTSPPVHRSRDNVPTGA